MPATSEKQRTLACIALSIKKGETKKSYSQQAAEMAESMSLEELEHYCKSPVKKG
jgi:hypothetical protein